MKDDFWFLYIYFFLSNFLGIYLLLTLYKPEYKTKNLKKRRLKSENIDFMVLIGLDLKVEIFENIFVRISMISPYFPYVNMPWNKNNLVSCLWTTGREIIIYLNHHIFIASAGFYLYTTEISAITGSMHLLLERLWILLLSLKFFKKISLETQPL